MFSRLQEVSAAFFRTANRFSSCPSALLRANLGRWVLQALAAFREGVPGKTFVRGVKHPPDPFLAFAGFKSWRAFEKGVRHFSISTTDYGLQITPSVPAPKGGYLYEPDKAVRVPAQADEIGRILLEQASDSTTTERTNTPK
jgi:hypothetical protein